MAGSVKNKKKALVYLGLGCAVTAVGAVMIHYGKTQQAYSKSFFAMDTLCTVTQYGDSDFSELQKKITQLDEEISAYNESGELYSLNQNGKGTLSSDCEKLLTEFISLYNEYGKVNPLMGAVVKLWNVNGENPSVPSDEQIEKAVKTADISNLILENNGCELENGAQLDFGAVGKGFALDEIKEVLTSSDIGCAVVSFGSSSLLYGKKPDNKDFTVSVLDPEADENTLLKFSCEGGFVSTSGGYERYFEADGKRYIHIFDEQTGYPAETDLTSVTVVCQSGILSDFLSTRIFIGGTSELDRWLNDSEIQLIAVDENRNIYCSESICENIEVLSDRYVIA